MTLTFQLHYHTQPGQFLAILGKDERLGNGDPHRALPMIHQGDGQWSLSLDWPADKPTLTYRYVLVDNHTGAITQEWGELRHWTPGADSAPVVFQDAWRSPQHPDNALYTAPFREVLLPPNEQEGPWASAQTGKRLVTWQIYLPRPFPDAELVVTGDLSELGQWSVADAPALHNRQHPLWQVRLAIPASAKKVAYKYAWRRSGDRQRLDMEAGPNRQCILPEDPTTQVVRTDDYYAYTDGGWTGAGVAIPVFSLRSETGLGVGEFSDLKRLADWAAEAGLRMIQILPVNDTIAHHTWKDSYPYAAISVFALNPLYLRIQELPGAGRVMDAAVQTQQAQLNRQAVVDLESVMSLKWRLIRSLYAEQQTAFLESAEFQAYYQDNKHWLDPYALFCYLRDEFGTAHFPDWGEYATFSTQLVTRMCTPDFSDYAKIALHYYVQFHLDQQLREAAAYAHQQGVILKGDLPIGIYRDSVDAWVQPHLYHMDVQAGAPPDPFSDSGQNWGFPTYNWTEMAKDDYQWWRDRMTQLSRYFDTYRIDHILGFFRIWQIPLEEVEGTMGYFNPAIPVATEEFAQRGLTFDFDRYCRPYITDAILHDTFGPAADTIKQHFLEPLSDRYVFRDGQHTQRAVLRYLEQYPDLAEHRQGLFDLIGNRLFMVQEEGGVQKLHPRIDMSKTTSFQALDPHARQQMHEIYIDYYYRRQEDFWRDQAMQKLPALREATDMLICGEDLGMVPACVPDVMRTLSILSLEIQRMSKNPDTEFLQVRDIPYLSVASPSTHDMAPIRSWWEEEPRAYIQRFYHQELRMEGEPPTFCEPVIAQAIIRQHLHWPSMWTVFPLQDLLAMDGRLRRENPHEERINVPADPNHYWQYRMHLTLEDLVEEKPFCYLLRAMLQNANRI